MRAIATIAIALAIALPAASAAEITGFYVADAHTDETLMELPTDTRATLNLEELGTNFITVYAKATDDTAGVRLRLNNGEVTRHERISPYALFGDNPAYHFPNDGFLEVGSHRLDATPYQESNFRTSGPTRTVRFSIVQGSPSCEFNVQVDSCDADTVAEEVGDACDIGLIRNHVEFACAHARAEADVGTPLEDLIEEFDTQDTENYFNGGTFLNDNTGDVEEEAPFIQRIYDEVAQSSTIAYPSHFKTFGECDIGAVVCMWIRDRQAGDNNGNCANPLDQRCTDADPADNTDLCYADASRAPEAAHVPTGIASWPGDSEGEVHAHGFAFRDGSISTRFKGNLLFYISMYDHLNQRGYAENVPLAPMCGCVDRMPTMSRADCTEVDVEETFTVSMNGGLDSLAAERIAVEIDFNACNGGEANNDLESEFETLYDEAEILEEFEKYLVGPIDNNEPSNCPE